MTLSGTNRPRGSVSFCSITRYLTLPNGEALQGTERFLSSPPAPSVDRCAEDQHVSPIDGSGVRCGSRSGGSRSVWCKACPRRSAAADRRAASGAPRVTPSVYTVQPGPHAQREFLGCLIQAIPGDVIELAAGTFNFDDGPRGLDEQHHHPRQRDGQDDPLVQEPAHGFEGDRGDRRQLRHRGPRRRGYAGQRHQGRGGEERHLPQRAAPHGRASPRPPTARTASIPSSAKTC